MEFISAIRERRERAVTRALSVLDLYAASEPEMRPALLESAARALPDSRVAGRWISTLAAESDQGLRRQLLRFLSTLDFRQVPQKDECVRELLACIDQPDAREWALYCLSRLAPHDPRLIAPLTAAFRERKDDAFKQRILSTLFNVNNPPAELIEFFMSVLDEVDEVVKISLVRRLLERDMLPRHALESLLAPTEPEVIKVLVLDHMVDRCISAGNQVVEILKHDPDAGTRYAAIWALTETGTPPPGVVGALLEAASSDPDDRVRIFAISAFEFTLAKTPEVLTALLAAIRTETSAPRVGLILRLLKPHLQRSDEVFTSLQSLLAANLNAEIAIEIYTWLGELAPWKPALLDWLVEAFSREKEDRIKAVILKALTRLDAGNPRIIQLCTEALKMPEPEIQQWGIQGILLLPAIPENYPAIQQSATLLLSRHIPLNLRLELGQKIAVIPDKPPELIAILKETASQSRDSQLRKICEDAVNRVISDASGDDDPSVKVDWDDWIHRTEVEHRSDGIFPAMYENYDRAPEKARRVLKALLNPQCIDNLYGNYGYDVSEGSILQFLDRKNAIDDEVSRFMVGRILTQTSGSADGYIQFLSSNPGYFPLKENILQIIEKRPDASPALLREVIMSAYGDEELATRALCERIVKQRSSDALKPFIRLALENMGWPVAYEMLVTLFHHRDLRGTARQTVIDAIKKLEPEESAPATPDATPEPKQGPGFADD